jgi:hypothetical protein
MGGGATAETPDIEDLEEIARRAREKYPEYDVGVVFGCVLRAALKGVPTPVPVEAYTEELLLDGIARQVRLGELDAQRAGCSR